MAYASLVRVAQLSWLPLNKPLTYVMGCNIFLSFPSNSCTYVAGPEWWLWHIGYRRSYSDLCGSNALPGGNSNTQYVPYCGNQCPARLLIVVLLYFLRVRHHEYAAAVMVLSQKYSSTYSLTLTHLSYVANLSGAMIHHAPMHMVLKTYIIEIGELKLQSNELSGGGMHMA